MLIDAEIPVAAPEALALHVVITMTLPTSMEPAPPGHVRLLVCNCRCPSGACTPDCETQTWILPFSHPLLYESFLLGPPVHANRLGPGRTIRALIGPPPGTPPVRTAEPGSADDLDVTDYIEYLVQFAEREMVPRQMQPPRAGYVRVQFRLYVLAHLFAMPRYGHILGGLLRDAARRHPTGATVPASCAEVAYVFAALPPHDELRRALTHALAERMAADARAVAALRPALRGSPQFAFDALAALAPLAGAPEDSPNELKDVMLQCRHSHGFAVERAGELAAQARGRGRTALTAEERMWVVQRAQRLQRYHPHENDVWI